MQAQKIIKKVNPICLLSGTIVNVNGGMNELESQLFVYSARLLSGMIVNMNKWRNFQLFHIIIGF